MEHLVRLTKVGTVAVVALNAPFRNALDPELSGEVHAALREAEEDPGVTAIVLASDGESYCSGANLKLLRTVAADPVEDGAFDALGAIYELFERMQRCSLPLLAAVNGAVVGAGVNLALACDMRIVADDVAITGFVAAGVHPGGGHLSMMLQRMSHTDAAAVALFGRALTGPDAVRCGFASECVPTAALRDRAVEIASGAGGDRALVQRTTRSFRASARQALLPEAAVLLERAPQVWSLRRRFAGAVG